MLQQSYVFLSFYTSNRMKLFSIRDYFHYYISVMMTECAKENCLTNAEFEFLVECCVYNSTGGNLTDFDDLWDYFKALNTFIRRRNDLSTYKKKLGERKWIRGSLGVFTLPKPLDVLDKGTYFIVWEGENKKKVTKLKFEIQYELDADGREQS